MLKIENLYAGIDGTDILKGLSLAVNAGEVNAFMGPNAAALLRQFGEGRI